MRKLIITAHPSSQGFTHTIASSLFELSTAKGHTVEILDLYATDLKQDFFSYENKKDPRLDSVTLSLQTKIAWADELVFVFPIWWSDMPAIMKNFWDCNFTAGFAFKYAENGMPQWLLQGKTARVIATSGAPAFVYRIFPAGMGRIWSTMRFGYCGIRLLSYKVFGNMDRKKTDRNAYLQSLSKLV